MQEAQQKCIGIQRIDVSIQVNFENPNEHRLLTSYKCFIVRIHNAIAKATRYKRTKLFIFSQYAPYAPKFISPNTIFMHYSTICCPAY